MNEFTAAFTPKNRAIVEKLFPDYDGRLTGCRVEMLMDAARQQGAQEALARAAGQAIELNNPFGYRSEDKEP